MFHNFTGKPFTSHWNGKPHTFKAGEKKYMSEDLAEHFAKHLTNQVLTTMGKELYCSPKKPQEVAEFYTIFKKAFIIEDDAEEQDEESLDMDIANRKQPSSSIAVKKRATIDPYDANAQKDTSPVGPSKVVEVPADDDEEFEETKK